MTKEEALRLLRTWPRWSEPTEWWVRKTLIRIGLANQSDEVRMSSRVVEVNAIPQHELPALQLAKQLVRVVGGTYRITIHTSYCGEGEIEKRSLRVIIDPASEQAEDDFFVRLDVENPRARDALTRGRVSRVV